MKFWNLSKKEETTTTPKDDTDAVIDQVLAELREEDGEEPEPEDDFKVDFHFDFNFNFKLTKRNQAIVGTIIGVLFVVIIFAMVELQTYNSGRVISAYEISDSGNNYYLQFSDGILKYSRDGIAYINRRGEEKWNAAYQIQNPMIVTCEDQSIAVADKGGNTIIVLNKDGYKGEMETSRPIERISISEQGIVCAILKTDSYPVISCFDAVGNKLVDISTSLTGTGFPLDISISQDGTKLAVAYLCVQNGQEISKVKYYNFSGENQTNEEYEIVSDEYKDVVVGSLFYMNEDVSVVVCDDRILFYNGKDEPKLGATVMMDRKIKSVFHSEKYVGVILRNVGKEGYEARLYDTSGTQVFSEEFKGDYSHVKLCDSQIIMYDGNKCCVFTKTGIQRFYGSLDDKILEIFPTLGINKYIVVTNDGIKVIRFIKENKD